MVRNLSGRARASLAAVTVAALVGSAAAAVAAALPASAAARPAGAKLAATGTLAAGAAVSTHDLSGLKAGLTKSGAKPLGVALPAGVPSSGRYGFLLKLDASSTKTAFAANARQGRSAARAAARTQLTRVTSAQNAVIAALPKGTDVLYRTHSLLAGVGVYTNVKNYSTLATLSGVAAIYPITPKTRSNSYAVPLQKAPQAWQAHSNRGEGSVIAVIDTGLDYTHADFGGPGTTAAYDAANAADTVAPVVGSYDPNKFDAGASYDLVGDAYNPGAGVTGGDDPVPDPNPLDCTDDVGHGTHVAGTAAGYGVTANGQTYAGAYSTSTDFSSFKVGPGMAPAAKLYSLRVFGCVGSTNVVGEAIDRAADPNGDGDPTDAADVINMSLGSDFGSPDDADSILSDAASAAGISVVVASGNSGDVYDTGGSPGNAPRTIAVANSTDASSVLDSVNVTIGSAAAQNYGASRAALYDFATKPDLTGVVARPAANRSGCGTFSTADQATLNGKVALLDWDRAAYEAGTPGEDCGSIARGANARAAGAIGFIIAYSTEDLDITINGDDQIPGVLSPKSAGDAIKAGLSAGNTVTVNGTGSADFPQTIQGNDDLINSSSSRNERGAGDLKPDVTAVGTTVFSAHVGTGSDGESLTGTSMATPMTAGLAALVNTAHPTWSAEQEKADIMNTADQDVYTGTAHTGTVYAPNRAGAGRIDAASALDNTVLAYVADDPGSVSVSFGPLAVTGTVAVRHSKTVKVQNTGQTAATYSVAYTASTSVPGASYAVSPSTVTVAPGTTQLLTVTLTINPTALTKTVDSTVSSENSGFPREFLADASGRIVLTGTGNSAGVPSLRVPVYSAPRPASSMTQPASVTLSGGKALLPLSGHQVNQGSGATTIQSLVAGFELGATSGLAPTCSATVTSGCVFSASDRGADVKYVGVTSDAPQLTANGQNPRTDGLVYFSITAQGAWTTAASRNEFDIYIDANGDGVSDFITYNTRLPGTDVLVAETVDLTSFATVDIEPLDARFGDTDAALFDSDTMVLPVALKALGISHSVQMKYAVASFSTSTGTQIDSIGFTAQGEPSGAMTTNPLRPGVTVTGSYTGEASPILFRDGPGALLQVRRDARSYGADHGQGALLVHLHNAVGNKAQRVALKSATRTTYAFVPNTVKAGRTTAVKITVLPSAGAVATGRVRLVRLTGPRAPVVSIGWTALVKGAATLKYSTAGLTPRLYRYRIEYTGDANYLPNSSVEKYLSVAR